MKVGRVYRLVLFVLVIVVIAVVVIIGNSNNDATNNTASNDEVVSSANNADEILVSDTDSMPLIDTSLPPAVRNVNPYFISGITPEPYVSEEEVLIPEDNSSTPARITSDPAKEAVIALGNLPKASIRHVVQKGDSLGLIAQKYYKRASMWKKIADANGITNPTSLTLGQVLIIPDVESSEAPPKVVDKNPGSKNDSAKTTKSDNIASANSNQETYTVVQGDSLWKIASKVYGNGGKWTLIYEANRKIMPKPDSLSPGMKLIIPPVEKSDVAPAGKNPSSDDKEPVKKAAVKKSVHDEVEVINFFERR